MKASSGPFEIDTYGHGHGHNVFENDRNIWVAHYPDSTGASEANALLFTRARDMLRLLREVAPMLGHYHGPLGGCTACDIDALLEDLREVEA